jgi:hypothetical protein
LTVRNVGSNEHDGKRADRGDVVYVFGGAFEKFRVFAAKNGVAKN